jgi:hypothetical protein
MSQRHHKRGITANYQHFLRFSHEGKVYQFKALPFGLASAPLIFTTVVRAFVAHSMLWG